MIQEFEYAMLVVSKLTIIYRTLILYQFLFCFLPSYRTIHYVSVSHTVLTFTTI